MLSFDQFLERKTADDIKWPNDCNVNTLNRKAATDICFIQSGGSHDKVIHRATNTTVTVIPRHRSINTFTCKKMIDSIKKSCY